MENNNDNKQTFKFQNELIELPLIKGSKDVFISYKRENAPYAKRLCEELNDHGISAWFDMNELHHDVGKEYTDRIHKGINNSKYFLLIYTKEVEQSNFIVNEEVGYAIEKKKLILFYPKDEINIGQSKLKPFVEKIQWLDTMATAIHQQDTIESFKSEKRLSELSALIRAKHNNVVFVDQSLFLIRIALQKLLGKITVFGNYKKLCGTASNEFYDNKLSKLCVINKAFFIKIPPKFQEELVKRNFIVDDKENEVKILRDNMHPDEEELRNQLEQFVLSHQDIYSFRTLYNCLSEYIKADKYKPIIMPSVEEFDENTFIDIVAEMAACSFIEDLKADKTMFNGAELGVYSIVDQRTPDNEKAYVNMQLYYTDYFTFKCMTEMYHILCSINSDPFVITSTQHVRPLAPFLCSLGMGGFLAAYIKGLPSLMWVKRSDNISSGDFWHFSYDETVSLLKDGTKDYEKRLLINPDGVINIDINNILFRALEEEVGANQAKIEEDNHGFFEIGVIKSERLEIELISQAILQLQPSPGPQDQIKMMHDSASDGYLEISKLEFIPLKNEKELTGRLLSPESYDIYKRMQERLLENIGKNIKRGKNLLLEDGSFIDDGAVIGDNCRIHRNVYIGKNVIIGSNVKIQNNNSIYEGVTLEDGVFIGTNVSFINDRYPRAIMRDGRQVVPSDWGLKKTKVCYGASIGAGAVIVCGKDKDEIRIGKFAMVAAGSVVLEDVPDYAMVAGNPAKIIKTNIDY